VERIQRNEIEAILLESKIDDYRVGNCTIVVCTLPGNFTLVAKSGTIDPKAYDHNKGVEICMEEITDKVWELEAYRRVTNELRR
jgi:hypothetical protein